MLKLVIVIIIYVNVVIEAKCPSNEALHPCDCHYDNIRCTGKTNYDIKKIFQSASNTLEDSEKHLKQFYLNNTAISVLEENVFHEITFEEITIEDAYNLTRISSYAFNQSNFYAKKVSIRATPIQNNRSDYEIFLALSQMVELQEIHLFDTDIASIPENAFQPINGVQSKLDRIFISFNRFLKSIGDYAFYELNNLTIIDIFDNEVDYIPQHLFEFRHRVNNAFIIITLSDNKLNSSSFEPNTFNKTGRIFSLDLSNNHGLKYLDQEVFEVVLDNHAKINLHGIELDCDCRMNWIIRKRDVYSLQITDAICSDDYDMFISNRDEFNNCTMI